MVITTETTFLLKFQDGGIVCEMTSLCKTSKNHDLLTLRAVYS